MKKILLILVTALLALASCRKETAVVEESHTCALSSLRFDITIERLETKGIKRGWENGDKVFIFFKDVNNAYVTMSYNGSTWSSTPSDGEVNLSQNGQLTAIYLPYVGDATPSYSDAWHFASGTDSYYLKAQQVDYYIREMDNQAATLGAKLVMTKANDASAQFYVPKSPGQNETMQLACNVVTPTGLASIALNGTVSSSSGSQGRWLTGYPATVDGEQGFYFYGMIADAPGSDNYFVLKDNGNYKHYYKGSTTLTTRGSYQLPAFDDWPAVAENVNVAGYEWYSLNDGASSLLEAGTLSSESPSAQGQSLIPSKTAWEGLLDSEKATRVPMTIGEVPGVLVVDKLLPAQYFFLHEGDYWSSAGEYFFKVATGGDCSVVSGTPATAYVRRILNVTSGGFIDPIDGGEI